MTDQSDILENNSPAPQEITTATITPDTAPQGTFEYSDQLRAIRNEETGLQKYASVEDALTGTRYAQEHIKKLESDNLAVQEELERLRRLEEQTARSQFAPTDSPSQPTQSLGKEDVYSLLKDYDLSKVHEGNRKSVRDTLVAHCNGDLVKASELLDGRSKQLNISRADLTALSQTSPEAVYELLGIQQKRSSPDFMGGTINAEAVATSNRDRAVPAPSRLGVGSTTKDLVNEWKASGLEAQNKNGLN